ncbi:F-box only protein 34 [Toxotes jaculatrix]|uniref:F-box only protein 34 n=1 Tax=Toxotes jaculatrix TaxID=941984 RepID=UPI001B3AA913|nr:F-box only protein 34 [Toxotes jaculatrix]
MHLKSYPKLVHSELRLDAAGVQTSFQRSSLFVSQQGASLDTCSSNHGDVSSSRLPYSVISTNTLRCSNATNSSRSVVSLWLKASSSAALQLLAPPTVCENDTLRLYHTATDDSNGSLDIWTVIKPGHVREKIAIFASEGGRTDGAGGSSSGSWDRTSLACTNHTGMSGLTRAVKAKGSWEENCSAKRRRRSGSSQSQNLQQDQRLRVLDAQDTCTHKPSPWLSDSTQGAGTVAEEEEQKVSVVEMVAFLEQRASEQQGDCKPLLTLQRSSTTITLSRAPHSEVREGSEVRGDEPESVKVSDMVAKLESECLRRRTEGDLSISNNSLRRTVGRVLLAAGNQGSAPSHPTSSSSSLSSLPGVQSLRAEPISCSETIRTETPVSGLPTPPSSLSCQAQEAGGGGEVETQGPVTETQTLAPPPQAEGAEPVPGLLFLCPPSAASACTDSTPPHTDSEPRPPCHRMTFDLESAPLQPSPPAVSSSLYSGSQSEKRRRTKADGGQEAEVVDVSPCPAAVPLSRHGSVSQDFLEMRQRLQQLLEPQPYLAVLPHHLLVKIFLLLPTQSLAALKCTCHYFKFVIENYAVRPADSLWVSDPRYRDDPCKQCKKRYDRGDVSLCRWHHKPYCQALPYGPGYWMCCHGAHRDAPGCNVGLHDNRWVPAFHSINVPIYRRSHKDD